MAQQHLTVKAWRRYGQDRLYVSDGDGHSLGYSDRLTGRVHVNDEVHRDAVARALSAHSAAPVPQQQAAVEAPPPLAAPVTSQTVVDQQPYAVLVEHLPTDLAENRAGGGAQGKADELRRKAPFRTLVARLVGVHTDERAWRVGAQGERIVADELGKLGAAWSIVHDVEVGERGANIDHVIVGAAGVFTVNAKYHSGKAVWVGGDTVLIDGHRQHYVRNARHEAARASRLLTQAHGSPVPVTGIVAVLARSWTIKAQPADGAVLVLQPSKARRHLQTLPIRYADDELHRLRLLVRRSTTWQPRA